MARSVWSAPYSGAFASRRAELSHSAGIRRTPNASRLSLSVCLFVTNAFRKIIAKMTDFHLYHSASRAVIWSCTQRAGDPARRDALPPAVTGYQFTHAQRATPR